METYGDIGDDYNDDGGVIRKGKEQRGTCRKVEQINRIIIA
jgi:hypothetical protein